MALQLKYTIEHVGNCYLTTKTVLDMCVVTMLFAVQTKTWHQMYPNLYDADD